MKANGIEADFIKTVREARPEDCQAIVSAMYNMEGRKDEHGELTSLGMLAAAVIEEMMMNGVLKHQYEEQGEI